MPRALFLFTTRVDERHCRCQCDVHSMWLRAVINKEFDCWLRKPQKQYYGRVVTAKAAWQRWSRVCWSLLAWCATLGSRAFAASATSAWNSISHGTPTSPSLSDHLQIAPQDRDVSAVMRVTSTVSAWLQLTVPWPWNSFLYLRHVEHSFYYHYYYMPL